MNEQQCREKKKDKTQAFREEGRESDGSNATNLTMRWNIKSSTFGYYRVGFLSLRCGKPQMMILSYLSRTSQEKNCHLYTCLLSTLK